MAVPKRKVTPSRRGNRRAHDAISTANTQECPNCGELKLPHHACKSCGFYDGKQSIKQNVSKAEDTSA